MRLFALLQASTPAPSEMDRLMEFLRTPIPDVSLWMVIVLLIVLWMLFRQRSKQTTDLGASAEKVLRERYAKGEISEQAYKKMLDDVRLRPKY